jgi:cytoplasmic iron level regulating protein YaaA (DUF328/UPF0246 family)
MITILSPAKRLNYTDRVLTETYTYPVFIKESEVIMNKLKKLRPPAIKKLMNINDTLAETNYERFQNWEPSFDLNVARQAITTFKGDVYLGIDAPSFEESDFEKAQKSIRILSGLHGILKPLDLIRPYRLEMGTALKIGRANNLYEYWGNKILDSITEDPEFIKDKTLINLASKEYSNVIPLKSLNGRIITPVFKEYKNGSYRPIHIFLKKARGYMTSYIIKNKIEDPESLKLFDWEGYEYNDNLSENDNWVFTRG